MSEDEKAIKDLISELRPFINMDGGDIEFIKYDADEKVVYVKLTGACSMCLNQGDTLNSGLLFAIQEKVSDVKKVINVDL